PSKDITNGSYDSSSPIVSTSIRSSPDTSTPIFSSSNAIACTLPINVCNDSLSHFVTVKNFCQSAHPMDLCKSLPDHHAVPVLHVHQLRPVGPHDHLCPRLRHFLHALPHFQSLHLSCDLDQLLLIAVDLTKNHIP